MQWFNHWKYKFGVVLEHLSFMSEYSDEDIASASQILATIDVLTGMTNDSRESVLNRGHTSNHSFVQDCSAMCSYTDYSQKPRHFNSQSYPNSHQGNHGNNSPGRFANAIVSTIITLTLTNLNPISIHTLHLILMPTLSPTALCLHPNVI